MIALRPTKGELPFELVHFGVAELPEETIVDGAITNEEPVTQTISELFDAAQGQESASLPPQCPATR